MTLNGKEYTKEFLEQLLKDAQDIAENLDSDINADILDDENCDLNSYSDFVKKYSNIEVVQTIKEIEKFARKDTKTGKGMNEGYCFEDGEAYFNDEEDAEIYAKSLGYKNLKEAYKNNAYYFTEWEIQEDESWYDEEGNEFNN